ncbi:MAG: hypothetical protein ACTSRG_18295 [Candidatus Helarchaeota archaeon]
MKNSNVGILNEKIAKWTSDEKRTMILGSLAFFLLLILSFFIELIYFEYSLGFEGGFEGIGGINFLKSDSFFLIFTVSIIFFEYFLYISYYSFKGPKSRIFKEYNVQELYDTRNKNSLMQKNLEIFFLIVCIVYIFDIYIKILINFLYQIIIIELFINFIFCFIVGTLFFPLIMVTLDTRVLNDDIFEKISKTDNSQKRKKISEIFQCVLIISILIILGNIFLLVKIIG